MENTEIIEKPESLPATIPELQKFIIVGNGVIASYKVKLKTLEKVEFAEDVRKQTLREGQTISEAVLLATIRLGELLEKIPFTKGGRGKTGSLGGTSLQDVGVTKKLSHIAKKIKDNKKIAHEIIAKAIDKDDIATRHDVLKAIKKKEVDEKKQQQRNEILEGLKKPKGNFDIIVVDPPWKYGRKYDADGGRVASPYPEMSLEKIKNIKLPTKKDCILWCWTTDQFIWDAKELLENWGFEYKCVLVWDKGKMGIGSWLRLQCEFCLLGVKGKPLWEAKDIRDIIREPRTEHSVKPESFYKMIDDNFVGRKLDYFGRTKREGWEIYGAGQERPT